MLSLQIIIIIIIIIINNNYMIGNEINSNFEKFNHIVKVFFYKNLFVNITFFLLFYCSKRI
jgi:hypothetical protein